MIVEYEDIYKRQNQLLLLFIKYELTKNQQYIEKVASEMELLKLKEVDCLKELLNELA